MFDVANTLAMFVVVVSAAYFTITAGLGVREFRRRGEPLGRLHAVGYERPHLAGDGAPRPVNGFYVYFLIPCLNEAAVIGDTVAALSGFAGRIVVVDDGSDDGTGEAARAAGGAETLIVRRDLPHARQGKGAALNRGFISVLADTVRWGIDPNDVVVCVLDADGRLSDGALHEVLTLFDDPEVGGAQVAVRIRNRERNFLLRIQDLQFWTLSALSQVGRIATGTVSMGGNGQFTRLAALLDLGATPWSDSLTEDLDLGISLALQGWTTTCTPRAAVEQEGLSSLKPLLRQRTRWYQGHMLTGRRIPEILRNRRLSHAASLELTLYLLVPWIFDLTWSVLFHLVQLQLVLAVWRGQIDFGNGALEVGVRLGLVYVLSFWPALVSAALVMRRDRSLSLATGLKLGHAFMFTNYFSFACCWRALSRIARGQTTWAKTAREQSPAHPAVRAHAAAVADEPALAAFGDLAHASAALARLHHAGAGSVPAGSTTAVHGATVAAAVDTALLDPPPLRGRAGLAANALDGGAPLAPPDPGDPLDPPAAHRDPSERVPATTGG